MVIYKINKKEWLIKIFFFQREYVGVEMRANVFR